MGKWELSDDLVFYIDTINQLMEEREFSLIDSIAVLQSYNISVIADRLSKLEERQYFKVSVEQY